MYALHFVERWLKRQPFNRNLAGPGRVLRTRHCWCGATTLIEDSGARDADRSNLRDRLPLGGQQTPQGGKNRTANGRRHRAWVHPGNFLSETRFFREIDVFLQDSAIQILVATYGSSLRRSDFANLNGTKRH
jgi:hypothetical protein